MTTPLSTGCRLRHLRRDDGMATVWMLYTGLIVVLLAGVVLGGGSVFGARTHGYDLAQQAARAGAQEIDLAAYRTDGSLRLDPAPAAATANRFLAAAGATGIVTVTAAQITVTATSKQATPMLAGFGHPTVTVTATASATPIAGGSP